MAYCIYILRDIKQCNSVYDKCCLDQIISDMEIKEKETKQNKKEQHKLYKTLKHFKRSLFCTIPRIALIWYEIYISIIEHEYISIKTV